VIPNGIETEFAGKDEGTGRETMFNWPAGALIIGTICRLTQVKNPAILLDTLTIADDVHLIIVGDGPERKKLEAYADRLGISRRVFFAGEQNDVRPWLRTMDIFCLASDSEGMPNALLEAMAAGLPVVASNVGGVGEIIDDRVTGLLAQRRDPDRFAAAISELRERPELRQRMGNAAAITVARRFPLARTISATESLYGELLFQFRSGHSRTIKS
jgi:glycosyltransferase involved in cell wall biosynthesis